MKELLEQIQNLIEETNSLTVSEQKEVLEPLFEQVYEKCHDNDLVDIRDMLKLSQLENQLTRRVIDAKPIIEPSNNINEKEKTIEQIIYYSRKKMESTYGCSVINDSLKARSLDFCEIILETAKNVGVSAVKFNLAEHFNIPFKHYIVLAYVSGKIFLLDLTYQQYFVLGNNFKSRYYEHPSYTRVCDIGGRMAGNRLNSAIKLIETGYIAEEFDIKNYFDAFMELSNQNKLGSGNEYLKILLNSLKGSNDKREKVLYDQLSSIGV